MSNTGLDWMPELSFYLIFNLMEVSYQKEVEFDKLEPEMQLLLASMIDHLTSLPLSVQRSFRYELSGKLTEAFDRDF